MKIRYYDGITEDYVVDGRVSVNIDHYIWSRKVTHNTFPTHIELNEEEYASLRKELSPLCTKGVSVIIERPYYRGLPIFVHKEENNVVNKENKMEKKLTLKDIKVINELLEERQEYFRKEKETENIYHVEVCIENTDMMDFFTKDTDSDIIMSIRENMKDHYRKKIEKIESELRTLGVDI